MTIARSSGVSVSSTNTRVRDSSAPTISNEGFSVVAPTSVTVPLSTCGRKASCCPRLKRWISSTNRIVPRPSSSRRSAASATISRTRGTPSVTAENGTNARSVVLRDEAREGRLPRARRSPEDHRADAAALDRLAEWTSRREQVLLARRTPRAIADACAAASGAADSPRALRAAENRLSSPAPRGRPRLLALTRGHRASRARRSTARCPRRTRPADASRASPGTRGRDSQAAT